MTKFLVTLERPCREYALVEVEADTEKGAITKGRNIATERVLHWERVTDSETNGRIETIGVEKVPS